MVKPKGLLLFHGAGGDKEHPVFQRIVEALRIPVYAINFSYRDQSPRRPPPRAEKLVSEVTEITMNYSHHLGVPPSHLLIGGRSMGGACGLYGCSQRTQIKRIGPIELPTSPYWET